MSVLKVSALSDPAGALAGVLPKNGIAKVQAIGTDAIYQRVKAIALTQCFVKAACVDLICSPAFTNIVTDGEKPTATISLVETR